MAMIATPLEPCSGNEALMSESDMRRTYGTAHVRPVGLAFKRGRVTYTALQTTVRPEQLQRRGHRRILAMQRDWWIDGGLRTVTQRGSRRRREAAEAKAGRYATSHGRFHRENVELAGGRGRVKGPGGDTTPLARAGRQAQAIRQRGLDRGWKSRTPWTGGRRLY